MKVSGSVLVLTAVVCSILGGLAGGLFVSHQLDTDVLTVKRINIVEEDGRHALVLANAENLPGVIRNGKEGPRGHRHNVGGILYYNNKGDEVGGLITNLQEYDGEGNGGVQISMDQLNDQGQTIALMHWMEGEYVRSALRFWDLPTDKPHSLMNTHPRIVPILEKYDAAETDEDFERIDREYHQALGEERLWAERIYLGSEGEAHRKAMLELKDSRSQPRIRLIVDEGDEARIEFLNAAGDVIRTLDAKN